MAVPAPQSFATNKSLITGAFVQEFHTGFEIACQQMMSMFESRVTSRGAITGSSFAINDMGIVEMVDRAADGSDRFADTEWSVPDAGTRVALMGDAELFIPIERMDLPKLLANPQGPYQQLMVAAANRKKDRVIYNALLGSIGRRTADMAGNAALTSVSLPSSQKLNATGTGGTAGATVGTLTKKDLIAIRAMFRKNEADNEEIYVTYNSDMLTTVLNDTSLTSADYMAVQMLQNGDIKGKWLGMNWVPYEGLKRTAEASKGDTLSAVAWVKSAVHFGTGEITDVDVGPRRDKRNVIQLSAQTSYGAGRANEKKVVQLDFKA